MSTELRVHSAKTFGMSSQQLLKTMPKDYIGTMEWVQKAHGDFVLFKAFGGDGPHGLYL